MPTMLESLPLRKFGLEFEIGGELGVATVAGVIRSLSFHPVNCTTSWRQSINNNYWDVKFDRTCGVLGEINNVYIDHGWEIASYIACGETDLDHIAAVMAEFERITSSAPNHNCGFHIHCDVSDFSPREIGILMARWIKIEPMLCQMVPEHRINNKFCRLLSAKRISKRKRYKPEEVWGRLKPTKYTPHDNIQKKVTLNTVNYAAALQTETEATAIKSIAPKDIRKTVEFRLPEGTLKKDAINGWVHFFVRFVESSKRAAMPTNLGEVSKIKQFFKYCDMSKINNNLDLLRAKLFLIERLYKFGNEEVKKQLSQGLF